MDRRLLLVSDGSTWSVAYSELTHLEVLKIAEQLVKALNKGMVVFVNPEVVPKPAEAPAEAPKEELKQN